MAASRNLDFQKRYFPAVFRAYNSSLDEASYEQAAAATIIRSYPTPAVQNEIVVVAEDFENVLSFLPTPGPIHREIAPLLKECDEVIIHDSHYDQWVSENNGHRLVLRFHHGLNTRFLRLRLIYKLMDSHCAQAAKVIFSREPDFFERAALRGKELEWVVLSDTTELEGELLHLSCSYRLHPLLKTEQKKLESNHLHVPFLRETPSLWIDHNVCQEIMNVAMERKPSLTDLQSIINGITLVEWMMAARELLAHYMIYPDFVLNYFMVQFYIESVQRIESELHHKWGPKLAADFEQILKDRTSKTEQFLHLQRSSVLEMGSWLEVQLHALHKQFSEWSIQRGVNV